MSRQGGQDTSSVTGRAQLHCEMLLSPIVETREPVRTAALPILRFMPGVEPITGSFACKGKLGCWREFLQTFLEFLTCADLCC